MRCTRWRRRSRGSVSARCSSLDPLAFFSVSGSESFYVSLDIVFGQLPPTLFNEYVRCVQTSDQLIHDVTNISTDTDAIYKRLVSEPILTSVEGVRSSYLMSGTRNSDVTEASAVSDLLRLYAVLLYDVLKEVHDLVVAQLEAEAEDRRLTSIPASLGLALGVVTIAFVLMSGARNMHSLFLYAAFMEKNGRGLKREKRKIDGILQEMLPKTVIYRLLPAHIAVLSVFT